MSGKQTYQQEDQVRRYLQNQMTEQERHAFEREMQRDPFLAEALEGFSSLSADLVFTDLAELKNRLQKHQTKNRRYIWYAAASVLVLLVSTFILVNLEEKTNPMVSENKVQKEESPKVEISGKKEENKPILLDAGKPISEKVLMVTENELEIADTEAETTLVATNKTKSAFSSPLSEQLKLKKSFQTVENLELSKAAEINSDSLATALIASQSPGTREFLHNVSINDREVIEKNVDKSVPQPKAQIAEQTILDSTQNPEALNEVVVVGYGVKSEKSLTGAVSIAKKAQISDGKAMPIRGWEAYHEYIKNELLVPNIGSPKEKTIVRLSFVVTETGAIEQFKILSGNDEKFNQEAIRIITDGPAWNPEFKNKIPQRSVVKLRMVFQPAK